MDRKQYGEYLCGLEPGQLENVIWDRLLRHRPEAPSCPLGRDEEPVDVLVDLAGQHSPSLEHKLRAACAHLMETQSKKETLDNVPALGELIWLAAAVDATKAIDALDRLAQRPDSGMLMVRAGESLRMRALRALSGLLAAHTLLATQAHREGFQRFLTEPCLQGICLTALVGLWRNDRDEFLKLLPQRYPPETLNDQLALAGFL